MSKVNPTRTRINGKALADCSREELIEGVEMLTARVAELEGIGEQRPPTTGAVFYGGPGGSLPVQPGGGGVASTDRSSPLGKHIDGRLILAAGGGGEGGPFVVVENEDGSTEVIRS